MRACTYLAPDQLRILDDIRSSVQPDERFLADCGADGLRLGKVIDIAYAVLTSTVTVAGDNGQVLTPNLVSIAFGGNIPDSLCDHAAHHAAGARDALPHDVLAGAGSRSHAEIDTQLGMVYVNAEDGSPGPLLNKLQAGTGIDLSLQELATIPESPQPPYKYLVITVGAHAHAGTIDGGTIDHGALTGRGDDDHTQYVLADGTRAFTGVPSCAVAPTTGNHLVNKTYADALVAAQDAMVFKGVLNCSASPNYPAADRGHTYKVSVAGKIGGASGLAVEVGDLLLCITDATAAGTQATVGANWAVVQANIDGAVIGPAASVNGNVPTFNGVGGKLLQDSGVAIGNLMTTAHPANAVTGFGPEPGAVGSSTSGAPGMATTVARGDHSHDLGPHAHTGATDGGTIDHGALTGQGDDDHTQYVLADGTRAFTGVPSCAVAPTTGNHLVNKTYADALVAAQDALVFKGVLNCSASPNYPAADRGHTYKVSAAGKVGGASGLAVEIGDLLLCITDATAAGTQATVGANWVVVQANIDGAVIGPAASVNGNVPTFNGVGGKLLQDSGVAIGNLMTTAHPANAVTGFGLEPGAVGSSTSGAPGTATTVARGDHSHDLGAHAHTGATDGGTIDHGALTGRGDDDHTQYVLADGTRAFTGVPSCAVAPTTGNHLVNKTYADGLLAANDAMVFKGVLDCSASPNYPAANRGDTYKVSVAGKIGGASGLAVGVGNLLICITDGTAAGTQATVGAAWVVIQSSSDGAVTGPATAASGNLVTFNGTTGKVIADSGKALANLAPRPNTTNAAVGYTYGFAYAASGTLTLPSWGGTWWVWYLAVSSGVVQTLGCGYWPSGGQISTAYHFYGFATYIG